MEGGEDVRYLGGVVPVSWEDAILSSSNLANILNGKRFVAIEVVEQIDDFAHFLLISNLSVLLDHLCKGHLPHPDHASPPGVCNIGSLQIVIELGKA